MLESYAAALRHGWSPNNTRDVSGEELAEIAHDPDAFIAARRDDVGAGALITLPDDRQVPRLPQRIRWIWDGEFSGLIGMRWQPGTNELPQHVLGHIGYAVVPWKRGHGLAKRALRHMLEEAREVGLSRLEISTEAENMASQKTILANRGRFARTVVNELYGPTERKLYVIDLQ